MRVGHSAPSGGGSTAVFPSFTSQAALTNSLSAFAITNVLLYTNAANRRGWADVGFATLEIATAPALPGTTLVVIYYRTAVALVYEIDEQFGDAGVLDSQLHCQLQSPLWLNYSEGIRIDMQAPGTAGTGLVYIAAGVHVQQYA